MTDQRLDIVAAIDVGTNAVRLMISEINPLGQIRPLEDLWKPTRIGHDTFGAKRISAETIHETCDTLKGFVSLMKDYRVRRYRAVSTTGIREAVNRDYVLEQIRLRTGLTIEVINNAEERFLVYKALRDSLREMEPMLGQGTMIANIGMGGVEVSVYTGGHLYFTDYVKIGSLRLRKILADLEPVSLDFSSIMKEFVESRIAFLEPYIKELPIRYFIGLGEEIRSICALLARENQPDQITLASLHKLYEQVRGMTTENVGTQFNLHRNDAEVLLPSLIIYLHLMSMTDTTLVYAPQVSLRQGILADMADEIFNTSRKQDFLNDIVSSVWYIAEKYHVENVHSAYVEQVSLSIFDQTWRVHRLGNRERLYLQVAAILHDIGKYVNANQHDVQSHDLIRSQDIMGLSTREMAIIANIARYHSDDLPRPSHESYRSLDERDRLMVSKLAAILKMAEALDLSHSQKITKIEANTAGREILFRLTVDQDATLELWNFENAGKFFEEVMGYRPSIKRKG